MSFCEVFCVIYTNIRVCVLKHDFFWDNEKGYVGLKSMFMCFVQCVLSYIKEDIILSTIRSYLGLIETIIAFLCLNRLLFLNWAETIVIRNPSLIESVYFLLTKWWSQMLVWNEYLGNFTTNVKIPSHSTLKNLFR